MQREKVIHRILPLRNTEPKHIPEKRLIIAENVDEPCIRSDCSSKRDRLKEYLSENEHLRSQLKAIENRVNVSRNKLTIMEKSIELAQDKNESIQGIINETQTRILTVEVEVGKGEVNNQFLRNKLTQLNDEIDSLKQQTDEQTLIIQSISSKAVDKVIFGPRVGNVIFNKDSFLAEEVASLGSSNAFRIEQTGSRESDDERF